MILLGQVDAPAGEDARSLLRQAARRGDESAQRTLRRIERAERVRRPSDATSTYAAMFERD